MSKHKNSLLEDFQKTKKTVLEYSENLLKEKVDVPLIFRNMEYQTDRNFADCLKRFSKKLIDDPHDCPLSDTAKKYSSFLNEYAGAIERKWIIEGNELKKAKDATDISSMFDPIKEEYENKMRSICEACRMKHEYEKK